MVFLSSVEEYHKVLQIEKIRTAILGEGPGSIIIPARIIPLLRKAGILITNVLKPSNRAKPTEEQIRAEQERRGVWKYDFFITKEILAPQFNKGKEATNAKVKKT